MKTQIATFITSLVLFSIAAISGVLWFETWTATIELEAQLKTLNETDIDLVVASEVTRILSNPAERVKWSSQLELQP